MLNALGEQIGMLEFQGGMRFKIVLEAWRKQGHGHIGMLLVLEITGHFSRPQPV